MARPLRLEYEGAVYHVTARGNERGKIFFSKRDYERFKDYSQGDAGSVERKRNIRLGSRLQLGRNRVTCHLLQG